jgi:UDP:flavonoid glycosyltransferase YjiC (YdhE family)
VPQDQVLPRADLVVTTGGFNTVLGALRWGLPFLVLPAAADHFAHAARCEELGVGRALHPRAAADGTLTDPEEPELRAAIEDLLAAPAYRARAAALRDSLAGVPDERHGAALLAEVAARGAVRASAFTELDGARS